MMNNEQRNSNLILFFNKRFPIKKIISNYGAGRKAQGLGPKTVNLSQNPKPPLLPRPCDPANQRTNPYNPRASNHLSASIAAIQPDPAAVIAWRYVLSCTSPQAKTPSIFV